SGLLQMACFSGRNKGFTLDGAGFEKMLDRWRVTDPARFFEQSQAALLDHGCDEFIVSVHRLKTLLAARQEYEHRPHDDAGELVLAGVNRYLHSPLKLKHALRTARQARKFVALDG
ncbi:MAG: hypothetical protein ACR2RL_08060, partial [Gammaproteobacteria bacterium]